MRFRFRTPRLQTDIGGYVRTTRICQVSLPSCDMWTEGQKDEEWLQILYYIHEVKLKTKRKLRSAAHGQKLK